MSPDLEFWVHLAALLTAETAVLAALAALIARTLRHPHPRRRLWQAALLSIAFVWLGELMGGRDAIAGWQRPARSERQAVVRLLDADEARPLAVERPSEGEGPATPARGTWWPGWLWLSGTVLLMGRGVVAQALLVHRARRALPADPDTRNTAQRLAAAMGLPGVTVQFWPGLRGPIAFGSLRPSIALPSGFRRRFDATQREAILAHELTHLAARDPLWLTAANIIAALAWWHPAVWWVRRRLQAEMEAAADTGSAMVPGGRPALAESLVLLGRELAAPTAGRGLGMAGAGPRSALARRVNDLLNGREGWRRPSRTESALATSLALLASGIVLVVPGVGTGAEPLGTLLFARNTVGNREVSSSPAAPAFSPADPSIPDAVEGSEPRDGTILPRPEADPLTASAPPVELVTRTYRLDPEQLRTRLLPQPWPDGNPEIDGAGIRNALEALGLSFEPPRSVFYGGRPGEAMRLMIRTTPEEIARVDDMLNRVGLKERRVQSGVPEFAAAATDTAPGPSSPTTAPEPTVTLTVHVIDIPEEHEKGLGLDWLFRDAGDPAESPRVSPPSGQQPGAASPHVDNIRIEQGRVQDRPTLLTRDQALALLDRLRNRKGVEILATPRVTSMSGRAARVSVQEVRSIVTGVEANDGTGTLPAGVNYVTEPLPFGPEIDLYPELQGDTWHLSVTARLTEFVGYDDPGPMQIEVQAPGAREPIKAQTPLPRLRLREAVGEARMGDGAFLLLRGPVAERVERVRGTWFRAARTETHRHRLYILTELRQ
ncbi:MAG: hypothetical protein KF833_09475 [Verrucomicrobiae bacterium]|nr:hypothetical protein [Verrucomicrobiae bacterium]